MKTKTSTTAETDLSQLLTVVPKDRYELTGVLGQGGGGTVFRARETISGRQFTVKVSRLPNQEAKARIEREIRLLTQLSQSDHVLELYDSYFSPDGKAVGLVMPYVEAESVEEIVERFGSGLPDEIVAAISWQVCQALSYAHVRSIVHRDVKPSNLLVTRNGLVKLCDFGIAVSESKASTITGKGNFVGTMRYAAPEVIAAGLVSPAVDVYSLGVTILFMILGRQPFESVPLPFLIQQILKGSFLQELPESKRSVWGQVLSTTLNPDPEQRPTAERVASLLRKNFPSAALHERKLLSEFLQGSGGNRLPPPNPPVALGAAPEPEDNSLKGLIQSLAGQLLEVQAAVADITAQFKQKNASDVQAEVGGSDQRLQATFLNVRRRLELNWRISLIMTFVLFSLFVAMLILAVVFGLIYQKSYWGLVFGGTSALSLLTVVVWKPMDKMLFSTIATQQLELIHLNYQRALSGNRAERREAFRDVSTQLNSLLTKVSTKSRS